jgi:plasmid replication initiation protein
LEDNYQRVNWQISLKQLRGLLNCTASSYDRFKEFNDKVLKRAFREINEKTSLKFEYEPTARVNRKFTKIEFRIVTKRSHDPGGQKVIEASVLPESAETVQYKYWSDVFGGNDILADICKITRYEFTKEEIEYIAAVLQRVPMEERLLLLNEVYTNMYRYAHRVKNRASYLAASLKKAIKKAIKDAEKEKEEALQEEHCSFNIDEWYSWAESYDPEKINFSEE